MRIGLHALGIGAGARPEIIRAVAVAAEETGFPTLWSREHVVMVDQPTSRYPYSADGTIAVPADADWLDPLLGLTYAAAVTSRIGLATGILLLSEHNPVLAAKQAATLGRAVAGRFTLGAGIGWSAEEFAALEVPCGWLRLAAPYSYPSSPYSCPSFSHLLRALGACLPPTGEGRVAHARWGPPWILTRRPHLVPDARRHVGSWTRG